MNLQALALLLLAYVERFSLDGLPDGYMAALADAINGALQEVWVSLPDPGGRVDRDKVINAPIPIEFVLTAKGDTTVVAMDSFPTWIDGCSIQIPGDKVEFNVISGINTDDDEITFRFPVRAEAGTITGTVYHDFHPMDATDRKFMGDPMIIDRGPLIERIGFSALYSPGGREYEDFGWRRSMVTTIQYKKRTDNYPECYFANRWMPKHQDGTDRPIAVYIHPLPTQELTMTVPVQTTLGALIDETTIEFGSAYTFGLPAGWDNLYLVPIAKLRWASSPFFKNPELLRVFQDEARTAREALAESAPRRPTFVELMPG